MREDLLFLALFGKRKGKPTKDLEFFTTKKSRNDIQGHEKIFFDITFLMDKHDVANALEEIAVLLDVKGENPFRIRAYQAAARSIINLEEDLDKVVAEKRLDELPGIGKDLASKITTLVKTGKLPFLEKLKKSIPESLLELLNIPGLGGRKIKILYDKLGIQTLEELTKACESNKLLNIKGFGSRSQEKILEGIKKLKTYGVRLLWWDAKEIVNFFIANLKKIKGVKQVDIAGSFRRKLETVGDLDFVVATTQPKKVLNWFSRQGIEVLGQGPTKVSIRLRTGLQADLRVVPQNQYCYALLYFTGSKDHSIELRKRALQLGFSLNEYDLTPRENLKSEEAIYNALGLEFIPPELRENRGEIQAAEENRLPKLVKDKDILGILHCHTTYSDGHNTIEEMAEAAKELGWQYIGISDHSQSSYQANGMDEKRLFDQMDKIKKLRKKAPVYIFQGLECDILPTGKLDFPNSVLKELDYVIASCHSMFKMEEKKMTARLIKAIENPYTTILGHITGRILLRREPYALNVQKVIDAAIANDKIIEINAYPSRLDMDWRFWIKAKEKGLKCCINPDAHQTKHLQYYKAGVNIARKGWLEKKDILNTLSLAKLKQQLCSRIGS